MIVTKYVAVLALVAGMLTHFGTGETMAQDTTNPAGSTQKSATQTAGQVLKTLVGSWKGKCRTWFKPGELADESEIKGTFKPVLNGKFLRHTYQGSIQGKPRSGEETIVFNQVASQFQVTWMDDFHMNYATMNSLGKATKNGFTVDGKYDVAPGKPQWGWKTVFEIKNVNEVVITAYNISPDGQEGKAVETIYTRVNDK